MIPESDTPHTTSDEVSPPCQGQQARCTQGSTSPILGACSSSTEPAADRKGKASVGDDPAFQDNPDRAQVEVGGTNSKSQLPSLVSTESMRCIGTSKLEVVRATPQATFLSQITATPSSSSAPSTTHLLCSPLSLHEALSSTSGTSPIGAGTPTPPVPNQRKRFSRSISQVSAVTLKTFSRPGTPSRVAQSSGRSDVSDGTASSRTKQTKGNFRDFFRLDSNKVSPREKGFTSSSTISDGFLQPTNPCLSRVQSRGRSYSAPSLFTSPRTPLQPAQWDSAFAASEPWEACSSSRATPFHSAISTPPPFETPSRSSGVELDPSTREQSVETEITDVFAHYLPLELQVRVMQAVLDVCRADWQKEVDAGEWRAAKARERWNSGEARGCRELARVGRVSKQWRRLSLDGQLWADGPSTRVIGSDAQSLEHVMSLFEESGPAIRTLDLQGYGRSLESTVLKRIVENAARYGHTNLTSVNLRGCTSLSSRSISELFSASPELQRVNVFALPMIVPNHLQVLEECCPKLYSLNVSRCQNLPASSLLILSSATARTTKGSRLEQLSVSALSGMTNEIIVHTFTRLTKLKSLDISFSPDVTDDAFRRITTSIASSATWSPGGLQYTPLELPSPSDRTKRSFPHLEALDLTGCTSLTSLSLSYLVLPRASTYASAPLGTVVPRLRHLGLSRLSPSFDAPDYLSSFLESVAPTLTKLDLEDGINLTDRVLQPLYRSTALETLIVNSCSRLTDQGILEIVQGCSSLRVLEVDGTQVSDVTARRFVELVRERNARTPQDPPTGAYPAERKARGPMILSILDNRLTGRRLHRELGNADTRTRTGYRGHWTQAAVGSYHDGPEDEDEVGEVREGPWKNRLEECEQDKVVVRSFYSSLEVDAANAIRAAREESKREKGSKAGAKGGLLRIRAMSDSVLVATGGRGGLEGRYGRVESGLSTGTGCIVM